MQPLVYVVDVGQGACNIIVLGKTSDKRGNRAIVIDSGPKTPTTPLEILKDNHVEQIDVLVVSHNDLDHYGGTAGIVGAYHKRIGCTYYVADRAPSRNNVFDLLDRAWKRGWLKEQPRVLSLESDAKRLFPDRKTGVEKPTTKLLALSPQGHEGQRAILNNDPNEASAVLVLLCGKSRLIFSGDSTIETWKGIVDRRNGRVIRGDILIIPHHGGCLRWPPNELREQLMWLFSEVVRCDFGLISVGTNNRDGHPRKDVLTALNDAGVRVACTEATESCANCPNKELIKRRKTSLPLRFPSHSAWDRQKVPCIGTIAIDVRHESVSFVDSRVHQTMHSSDWGKKGRENSCPISWVFGKRQ